MTIAEFIAIKLVDDARVSAAYNDNGPASRATEWLLFNARSMIRAEAQGDANYVLHLARARHTFIQSL
jgi:hypothetical protein